MIVNFSIQNFGSIKDKQTLSFEADKSTHLEDTYVVNVGGHRVLKLALIYGANASGKTTILKALNFLRQLVIMPKRTKTDNLDFTPFLFDNYTKEQTSSISIEFIHNNVKYSYEIEFTREAIISEELNFYKPKRANVFRRTTNIENQFTEITLGNKIAIDKVSEKNLAANTLWNNTVFGGFLKTNIEIIELQEVVDWFRNFLKPLIYTKTVLNTYITDKIRKGEVTKSDVITILRKADLNISDIRFEEEKEDISEVLFDFLQQHDELDSKTIRLSDKAELVSVKTAFEHSVDNKSYMLPFDMESEGTKRYYGFAGLLAMMIRKPTAFSIDELESSLHPDLYLHFLLSFLLNSTQSQLIATTHNREILDDKDIFRNDVIWFTDKQNNSATQLYSLADFDSSVVRNTTNILNAYKSGKLSGTPNLGDRYIDLNK